MPTIPKEQQDSIVGINIGNGFIKGRSGDRFMPKTPAIVANVQEALEFEGFAAHEDDIIIEYKGVRYAIGYSATRLNRVAQANRGGNRITSDYYRLLFLAALTQLTPRDRRRTFYEPEGLVIVAPITSYQNDRDNIKNALAGSYELGIVEHGKVKKTVTYNIRPEVLRVVPEGFSTIASLTITEDGVAHDPVGYSEGTVGIVNFGTGTTDLMFFNNMKLIPAKCDGRNIGISNVWEEIRRWARKYHNRELTDYQVDEALTSGYFMVGNQPINLHEDDFLNASLYNTASQGINLISSTWDDGKDCQFLLVSGGAGDKFYRFIKETFKHAECVPNPVHAEASGAYLYGLLRSLEG